MFIEKEIINQQHILFVDFNGVISYNPFWNSLRDPSHPLHSFYAPVKSFLFGEGEEGRKLIEGWMVGKYTSEEIHQVLAAKFGVPYNELFQAFRKDCENLDISRPILEAIKVLKKDWYCILRTDNMDSFHRFTLVANQDLPRAFDEVHNSNLMRELKRTGEGKYYPNMARFLLRPMKNCVLIDDGKTNCDLFEKWGGTAYCTQDETEVLAVLENLNGFRI